MIKNILVFFLILINFSYADDLDNLKDLYSNKEYAQVCSKSGGLYLQYKDNEEFLNIYAYSCLKSDMINRLILPIIKLRKTKQSRENAAYFATILFQKKLLYLALCDNIDISYINLPKTNYILSTVFDKFIKGDYELKDRSYWFNDDLNISTRYKLSVETRSGVKKIYLRTYKNDKLTKTRVYW